MIDPRQRWAEQDGSMRRAILTSVLVGALALTGAATAAAFVLTTPGNSSTGLDIAPITGSRSAPEAPAKPTPTATPTHSSGGTVVVTPHGSEDVGDDHGGNSGHGGGSDDDSSGHGGDDD